ALNCEDVLVPESQIRVHGKGNKMRCLPLPSDTVLLLDRYLRLERPVQCGPALFVSLKGPARGARMTLAGMRSLFRHHRRVSQTAPANPHRFRHTFASDMVRASPKRAPSTSRRWRTPRIRREKRWRAPTRLISRPTGSCPRLDR